MQSVGIAGDCSEAASAPNRPSRQTEAAKQDTQKNEQFLLNTFNRRRKIFVQINKNNICANLE